MSGRPVLQVTWAGCAKFTEVMTEYILQEEWKIDCIIAIARGGLIPAGMLSHSLGVRKVAVVALQTYDNNNRQQTFMQSHTGALEAIKQYDSPHTLVVDDIADTGATLNVVAQFVPRAKRCALIGKPQGAIYLHSMGHLLEAQEIWVHFPWESPSLPS